MRMGKGSCNLGWVRVPLGAEWSRMLGKAICCQPTDRPTDGYFISYRSCGLDLKAMEFRGWIWHGSICRTPFISVVSPAAFQCSTLTDAFHQSTSYSVSVSHSAAKRRGLISIWKEGINFSNAQKGEHLSQDKVRSLCGRKQIRKWNDKQMKL